MTEKEQRFFDAVKSSNQDKIIQFINDGIDVNVKDCDGWTALMHAAENDDVKTVELLAKNGANLDLKNDDGETALMIAAYENAKEAGEFLLINGADAEITDKWGRTAYRIVHENYTPRGISVFLYDGVESAKRKALNNMFCDYFFSKNYGDVITEKELEVKFRHIDDLKDEIYRFINYNNENGTLKFIKTIEPGVFLILPSRKEIKMFLDVIFLNKPSGTKIKRRDLHDCFRRKYNVDLCEINLGPYITKYDNVIIEKDGDFVIPPSAKQIEVFLSDYGKGPRVKISFDSMRDSFFQKYNVDLDSEIINKYISQFRKRTNDLLLNFIEKGRLSDVFFFTVEELKEVFEAKTSFDLVQEIFSDFYDMLRKNPSVKKYSIEKIQDELYARIPRGVKIEFVKEIFCSEPPRKYSFTDFRCVVNSLEKINKLLVKKSFVVRTLRNDPQIYILTYDTNQKAELICHALEKYLRLLFLESVVGDVLEIQKVMYYFRSEYDIDINDSLLKIALDEANEKLIDIKIVENIDSKSLMSDFKFQSLPEARVFCPICKNVFENYKEVKNHILNMHTTDVEDRSILTRTTSGFYCHHCKRNSLVFDEKYNVSPSAVLMHINGDCKGGSFVSHGSMRLKNSQAKGIWKGTMYSNDLSTLGNSGQMFRDGGQFGSFPSEDNYGNGDTNF